MNFRAEPCPGPQPNAVPAPFPRIPRLKSAMSPISRTIRRLKPSSSTSPTRPTTCITPRRDSIPHHSPARRDRLRACGPRNDCGSLSPPHLYRTSPRAGRHGPQGHHTRRTKRRSRTCRLRPGRRAGDTRRSRLCSAPRGRALSESLRLAVQGHAPPDHHRRPREAPPQTLARRIPETLDRRASSSETRRAPPRVRSLEIIVRTIVFTSPSSLSPLPGCPVSGSRHDDPQSHFVIFHPGPRGSCFHPGANTFLELARLRDAARNASEGRLPGFEILPPRPPQPEDRRRDGAWLSSSFAGTAAVFFLFAPGRRNHLPPERCGQNPGRDQRHDNLDNG